MTKLQCFYLSNSRTTKYLGGVEQKAIPGMQQISTLFTKFTCKAKDYAVEDLEELANDLHVLVLKGLLISWPILKLHPPAINGDLGDHFFVNDVVDLGDCIGDGFGDCVSAGDSFCVCAFTFGLAGCAFGTPVPAPSN